MIIDDELQTRKQSYKVVLENRYDVIYSDNIDLIYDQIKKDNVDLYIIDMNLDSFIDPKTKRGMNVKDILCAVGKNRPIILLSRTYPDLAQDGRLQTIIKETAEEEYNVCSFLTYQDIQRLDPAYTTIEEENINYYKESLYSNIDICIERNRFPYDFGIVCALDEELKPFLDMVQPDIEPLVIDGFSYGRGIVRTQNNKELKFIEAVPTRMGIGDASILATHMASHLGVKTIFMIGVCGGRDTVGVNIGDVVVPLESIAFQRGKLKEGGFSSEIESSKHKECGKISEYIANQILSDIYKNYVLSRIDNGTMEIIKPSIHYEVMACADYVIDKKGVLDEISNDIGHRKLCAVDMESYAIYRVGELLGINTLVIKSVMDLSNNKTDKYKEYAAYMAANYLYQLIYREMLPLK